jgi:acyl carrier protein
MKHADIARTIATRDAMLARLRAILIDALGVRREPDEIDPDTPLFGTGLGLDSIDAVELLVTVEAEFRVRIPDEIASRSALRTLNTVIDTVLTLQQADAGV